jgi:hypothetical protein
VAVKLGAMYFAVEAVFAVVCCIATVCQTTW